MITETEQASISHVHHAAEWRDLGDDVATLTSLREAAGSLARAIEDQVRAMRASGASWSQIGTALDMSKQAAQQRYRSLTEPV
jgi:hypothetical protein